MPDWDNRSVISVDDHPATAPPAAAEVPSPPDERPAVVGKDRYGAMHPERDPEAVPLTNHEKRQLRKLTQQLVSYRIWDDVKATYHGPKGFVGSTQHLVATRHEACSPPPWQNLYRTGKLQHLLARGGAVAVASGSCRHHDLSDAGRAAAHPVAMGHDAGAIPCRLPSSRGGPTESAPPPTPQRLVPPARPMQRLTIKMAVSSLATACAGSARSERPATTTTNSPRTAVGSQAPTHCKV